MDDRQQRRRTATSTEDKKPTVEQVANIKLAAGGGRAAGGPVTIGSAGLKFYVGLFASGRASATAFDPT